RYRRAAARGLGSLAVASGTANQIGKRLVTRRRPGLAGVPLHRIARRVPTSSSFPSGHSASAAAFAAGAALEAPELAIPLGALAAAVAYSRVYTGVHYPGDVVAGVGLGLGAATLVSRVVPLPSVRSHPDSPPPVEQPQRPTGRGLVVVINPASGVGRNDDVAAVLAEELPEAEVVHLRDGDDLATVLAHAADRAELLGISGGDGSLNAAADAARRAGLPLVVFPEGTFNHFAGDLGLPGVREAVAAVRTGSAVRISVGTLTAESPSGEEPIERIFLNTASMGSYPDFVAVRERWEKRLGKPLAAALAVRRVMRSTDPVAAIVAGQPRRLGLIFIGSNSYEPRGFAPRWRPDLDDGMLDVRLLDQSRPHALLRFALALLLGRVRESRQYVETHVASLTVELETPVEAACDGEVFKVGRRLTFSMDRDSLTVLGPRKRRG
nr:phosphatase PAP2 family protein [Actinomycetota bacterium]